MSTRARLFVLMIGTVAALYLLNKLSGGNAINPLALISCALTGALGNILYGIQASFVTPSQPETSRQPVSLLSPAGRYGVLAVACTQCFALLLVNLFVEVILSDLETAQTMKFVVIQPGHEGDVRQFFIGTMVLAAWIPWLTWLGVALGRSQQRSLWAPILAGTALGWGTYQVIINILGPGSGLGNPTQVASVFHMAPPYNPAMRLLLLAMQAGAILLFILALALYPWIVAQLSRGGTALWRRAIGLLETLFPGTPT